MPESNENVLRVMSSLPRSGTHWVKLLLSHLIGKPHNEGRLLDPEILRSALESGRSGGLLYDHFEFDTHGAILNRTLYPSLRMIILFRNPLDSLISMYHRSAAEGTLHDNSKGPIENLKLYLHTHLKGVSIPECFHQHPMYPQIRKRDHLRWFVRNYVIDWIQKGACLKVRYEDLLVDTKSELKRVADFMKIPYTQLKIEESERLFNFRSLSGGRNNGEVDLQSHYRRGISGEWREVIAGEDLRVVKEQIGDYLQEMGYDLS